MANSDHDLANEDLSHALVGSRRVADIESTGVSSTQVAITYAELNDMAAFLCHVVYQRLNFDSNGPPASSVRVPIIGIAISASSPLFALSCHAIHMTHDESKYTTPLVLAPLDTEDPTARSKQLLQCLRGNAEDTDSYGTKGSCLSVILTSGAQSVSHWRRLLENCELTTSSPCAVIDVAESIREADDFSADKKLLWMWEEINVGGVSEFENSSVGLDMWGEDDDEGESECVEDSNMLASMSDLILEHKPTRWRTREGQKEISGAAVGNACSLSHIAFTSGSSTGTPKGCAASVAALRQYCDSKNQAHGISSSSKVLLVSAATFDPALSDVIATFRAKATLVLASRSELQSQVGSLIQNFGVTHILGTPSWFVHTDCMLNPSLLPSQVPTLQLIALGGENIPSRVIEKWARHRPVTGDTAENGRDVGDESSHVRLCATYGVTEACVYQSMGEIFRMDIETSRRQDEGSYVGVALSSIKIRICAEDDLSLTGGIASQRGMQLREIEATETGDSGGDESRRVGEVVLEGSQIDKLSGYFNYHGDFAMTSRTALENAPRFPFFLQTWADGTTSICYRTGDRGYLSKIPCPRSGDHGDTGGHDGGSGDVKRGLFLLGRIAGAPRMIKFNGVRIDPLEIEACLQQEYADEKAQTHKIVDTLAPLIRDCAVIMTSDSTSALISEDSRSHKIVAYCVLSDAAAAELGFDPYLLTSGIICPPGPLLTLLRMRCVLHLKHGVAPAVFVLINVMPLTSSGKRYLAGLPALAQCHAADASNAIDKDKGNARAGRLLVDCSGAGPAVAAEIITCLNLQPCQHSSVTTKATFAMLGCDSLAVTRIVRALYASHHGVSNSRTLGGKFGALDDNGAFAVRHVFQARNLGEYVAWLNQHQVCQGSPLQCGDQGVVSGEGTVDVRPLSLNSDNDSDNDSAFNDRILLYDCLLEAITLSQTRLALSLLALGVDPALSEHGGRLAKVSGRLARRKLFKSNPLHLSCMQGEPLLVEALLSLGYSCTSPDPNGSFPLHLVCLKLNEAADKAEVQEGEKGDEKDGMIDVDLDIDGANRVTCLQLLLDKGKVPLTIKDGNKQTILHCVARTGNPVLTEFVMSLWRRGGETGEVPSSYGQGTDSGGIWDWRDRWGRSPVHWAVLNGHVKTLQLLLEGGCDADPASSRRTSRSTSAENESPLEICERLYLLSSSAEKKEVGRTVKSLLVAHTHSGCH